tara:strand:+ start:1000 stop:1176 length:177 start_codon:yes stop_codon:yes gene_type:complete
MNTTDKHEQTSNIQTLKKIAKGSDLEDMLIHSANELRDDPSDINQLHVKQLISILSHN